MQRRDDLIGLLRSLDRALSTVAPPPGHEARLRARLAPDPRSQRGPIAVRTIALAFCALLAAAGVWLAWTSPSAPDVAVQPIAAPSASEEIGAEPRPSPSATSSASTPRRRPLRMVPALPVRLAPPHSERAPGPPSPEPFAPRPPAPETPARTALAPVTPSAPDAPATPARDRAALQSGRPAPGALAFDAPAAREGRDGPLLRMGALSESGRAASDSAAAHASSGAAHGSTPRPAHEPTSPEPQDPKPESPADTCQWSLLDLGGKCLSPADLKAMAVATCEGSGQTLGDLAPAFDCEGGSTMAKLSCCEPGSGAATPDNPEMTCKQLTVGDGVTCLYSGVLEKQAAAACELSGLVFGKSAVEIDCGDGTAALITAWCCPPANEPAANEPSPAFGGAVGDGTSCVQDDLLEAEASEQCEALGLKLFDFYAAADCEGDASTIAKYLCVK